MEPRFRDAILAAAAERRPSAVGYVNLHNFKAFNVLVGHERGDAHLARVLQELARIGRAWRVAGDGFVVLGEGRGFIEALRGFSWRMRAELGATEAWAFGFEDGRQVAQVPWRNLLVICTPRCGVAEIGGSGEREAVSRAVEEAEACCEAMRDAGAAEAAGFAGLGARPWSDEQRLAEKTCPGCGAGASALVVEEEDLGWARERCDGCGARYERSDKLWVLGEEQDAAYM